MEKIDFADYIRTMATHMMSIHEISERCIKLELDLDEIFLDINQSIPLGLITHELISNSFQHAFPEQSLFNDINQREKRVQVTLKKNKDQKAELLVKDNGVGLPENYKDRLKTSLGMILVKDLVTQLKGEMSIDQRIGTAVKIKFCL
jgi:two-component sensor histidine kinase